MSTNSEQDQWLEAIEHVPEPLSKRDRSRQWLHERRRDRARKSLRRRLKKIMAQVWDIETRLVSQGLAFGPAHAALQKAIDDLNAFRDVYDKSVASQSATGRSASRSA